MTVIELAKLPRPEQAALRALVESVGTAHQHPALPEPQLLAATGKVRPPAGERIVLARRRPPGAGADGPASTELAGSAILSPGRDGSTVVHVVDNPAAAGTGVHAALLRRAVEVAPAQKALHLWVMQARPADDERAAAEGFVPERDLLQMRVPLPLGDDVLAATRPLATRPFVPGRDEASWVDINNRAFAGHPEQGGWTVADLRERMAADWVDLDGFLVADDPDGPGLIGACWTKVHRDHDPVLGEIYVIDVDPRHHGHGWGRSLTVAGLVHLAGRGITVGMLYTDASNEAAVGLYRSLGFTVDHVDRSYRRAPLS